MATHSSILAWEIKWTEEPGGLQSVSQVGHDLATKPPSDVRIITSWSLGQVRKKVSPVSRVWVKQALVQQGMYGKQENTHLEWPDQTPTKFDKIIILKNFSLITIFKWITLKRKFGVCSQ